MSDDPERASRRDGDAEADAAVLESLRIADSALPVGTDSADRQFCLS